MSYHIVCWLLVLPLSFLVHLLKLNVVLPCVPAPLVAHALYNVVHSFHLFFLVPLVQSCVVMPRVPAPLVPLVKLRVVMPPVPAPLVAHAALYNVDLC